MKIGSSRLAWAAILLLLLAVSTLLAARSLLWFQTLWFWPTVIGMAAASGFLFYLARRR